MEIIVLIILQFYIAGWQNFQIVDDNIDLKKDITTRDKPILNREYVSFVMWSEIVYGCSYPEYIKDLISFEDQNFPFYSYGCDYFGEATPQKYSGIFENYIFNPKYLNYPVTGISDYQLNEFLKWASDRYNENQLIDKGYLQFNYTQKDEDCFVLESYLVDQYYGDRIKENTVKEYKKVKYIPTLRMPFREELSLIKTENKFREYEFGEKDFLWKWDSKIIDKQANEGFLQVLNYFIKEEINLPYKNENLIEFDLTYKSKISAEDEKEKYSDLSYLNLDSEKISSYKQKDKYGRMDFEVVCFKNNDKIIVANRKSHRNKKPNDYLIYRMVFNKRIKQKFLPR